MLENQLRPSPSNLEKEEDRQIQVKKFGCEVADKMIQSFSPEEHGEILKQISFLLKDFNLNTINELRASSDDLQKRAEILSQITFL